jgi:hypothetical protein
MRDQYAGDISDFLKLSLLRAITAKGMKLGIAWYYISGHDNRPDGRHLEYLEEDFWRALDPSLYAALKTIRNDRSVRALEALPIWENPTLFHRDVVEIAAKRAAWANGMVDRLKSADVIFADPDNGLSRDGIVHRKSATWDEVQMLSSSERPVVLIRFPSRFGTHQEQLILHHQRLSILRPVTLRTCVTVRNKNGGASPRIRWFTMINASKEILASIQGFQRRLMSIKGVRTELAGL